MRGINRVLIAGHVADRIVFAQTNHGADVCSFFIASERPTTRGLLTATIKINVYVESLVATCRGKLEKGCYVLVEGELMNRDSPAGRTTEVRAWELSFFGPPTKPTSGGNLDVPDRSDRPHQPDSEP